MNSYQGDKFLCMLYDYFGFDGLSDKMLSFKNYLSSGTGSLRDFNKNRKSVINYLRDICYDRYVVKYDDVSLEFLSDKKRLCNEMGYSFSKKSIINKVIRKQKVSFDKWFDYLISNDIEYPVWVRYWMFFGMLELGSYDYSKHSFFKRCNNNTSCFAKFDKNALDMCMDMIMNYYSFDKDFSFDELDLIVFNNDFGKMYARCLWDNNIDNDFGKWKVFTKGSDSNKLFDLISGKFTSWDIDDKDVCKKYLSFYDLFIYFTKDFKGEFSTPRVLVVVSDDEIVEIKGISDSEQNVECEFFDVIEDKLNEFYHDNKFDLMLSDMRRVYDIISKDEVSVSDLKFMYEDEGFISYFGNDRDFEIDRFLNNRNKIEDYASMYNCPSSLVGNSFSDLYKDIYLYLGDISIDDEYLPFDFHCPAIVLGDFEVPYLKDFSGLENLYYIKGNLVVGNDYSRDDFYGVTRVGGSVISCGDVRGVRK